MAGKPIERVPVDAGAFRSLLSAKGLTASKLAHEMGSGANWIDLNKGLQPAVVSYLKAVYQISPEQYKRGADLKPQANMSVSRQVVKDAFTDVLNKDAVRSYYVSVVKRALTEFVKEDKELLVAVIKEAVNDVLNE